MPSFILRDLNPDFWAKVQAKAAADGTTVKAVILRLLTSWLAALIVLSVVACGYKNPIAPTVPDLPQAGVPSRIELSANPGMGADAGSGVINVRVLDAMATALPTQTVTVTASEGTLSAPSVVTNDKGAGRLTITGQAGAAITIIATSGAVTQKTQIAMQAGPDAAPPTTPPIFPPPSPPPPPPPPPVPTAPSFTITVSASPSSLVVNGSATLTATVTLNAGATAPTGYAWDCDADGTFEPPTAVNSKACNYAATGTIKSAVRVTGANASGVGSVDVTVAAAAPLAVSVSASSGTPALGAPVTFTGTVTSTGTVPATPLQWEWDFGDGAAGVTLIQTGTTAQLATLASGYGSAGVKTIKLKVTDPLTGRTASGTTTTTVAAALPALQVTLTPPATIAAGVPATFTGTASSTTPIPSTTALTWEWDDEGDGFDVTSTGHAVTDSHSHPYAAAGPRTVRVRVTDPATGRSATAERLITVVP